MIHRILGLAATTLLAATSLAAQAAPCPITTVGPATALPGATVGAAYSQAITASNSNAAPFQFAVSSGLPAGAGLGLSGTGPGTANFAGTPALAGTFLVTLSATDTSGCGGGRTYALAVAQGSQTIAFTTIPPETPTVGGPAYNVLATATSGLPVSLSIAPASSAVCSIAGSAVTFQSTGNCTINANQAGNANWAAAAQVQQTFSVGSASQSISFTSTAPAAAVVGGAAYTVTATATSGLPVSFSIDASASGVCAIAAASVTFQAAGTCVVNANQAGNATYNAAPQVQQSFVVGKANQSIAFSSTAPSATVGGAAYAVAATATSGLAVTFTIDASASAVCTIAGASVTFQSVGTCVINANQAGNANYNPAPQVQQSFAVAKGNQTVSFSSAAPVGAAVAGPSYSPTAVATSGLPVTLSIDASASGVCSIAGGAVTFQSVGTCVVNANQAGDANWNAAAQVQQSFVVNKGVQSINFTSTAPVGAVVAGATYTPAATATSGLPVTLSIDASAAAVCAISGGTVSFQAAGTCIVNADQAGDANWLAASRVQQSFAVGPGTQTISFTSTAPADATVGAATYSVAATATSGLAVSFSIDASASAVCSIAGNVVSFTAAGTCVINANQPGDANWSAAPQVQQSFSVSACQLLAVGQVIQPALPGGADLCLQSPVGTAAEFTYIAINHGTSADITLSFTGNNIQAVTGPPTPRPAGDTGLSLAPLVDLPADSTPVDPHAIDVPAAFPPGHAYSVADLVPQPQGGIVPLTVGQLIDINASVGACGAAPDIRKGRVEAVTTPQSPGQTVLYLVQEVTELSPGVWTPAVAAGAFQAVDFQNIGDSFVQSPPGSTPGASFSGTTTLLKTGAMDIETANLGAVSDVDNNGGVIVFYTRKLNELSPPASSQFVLGLFQQRDLFAAASCGGSNQGELLYMAVPDSTGAVNSNVRTQSLVYGQAGPTLVHHYQHLLNASRRLYFNGAAPLEALWLDEALSWSMQELVFYSTSVGLAPRGNIQLSTLTTGPSASVRVAAFNTYQNPIYGAMRSFFYQVGASNGSKRLGPLRQTPFTVSSGAVSHDVLAQNFAMAHTFLRYALDRKNTGDAALFNALVNTSQTGLANLQAVLNVDLDLWTRDFLTAVYTDDAVAGVTAEYTTPSWNYRSVFGGLGGFPLAVDNPANTTPITLPLGFGGGARYERFGIAAGQTATLTLTNGGSPAAAPASIAVVRTK